MSAIAKLGKSTIIYFFGNILSRSIGFLLLPLYTRFILPEDYGYFDLSVTYLTLMSSVVFFEIHNAILRYIINNASLAVKNSFVFNGMTIFFTSSVLYTLIFFIVGLSFDVKYIYMIYLCGLLENFMYIMLSTARGYGKNLLYAISGFLGAITIGLINVFFLVYLRLGFLSLYCALLTSYVLQILFLEYNLKIIRQINRKLFNFDKIKQLLFFALPLCFNSLAYWGITGYNKIVIRSDMGIDANGLYAVAEKFSVIINLLFTCFLLAWQELAFAKGKDDSCFYNTAINSCVRILGIGTVLLLPVISIMFPLLMSPAYLDAKVIIPLMILGTVVCAVSTFLGSIYGAIEKTKIITVTTFLGGVVNICLVRFFAEYWGFNGVNTAFVLAFIVCVFCRIYVLKKYIYIDIDKKNIFLFVVLFSFAYSLYIYNNVSFNLIFFFLTIVLYVYIYRKQLCGFYLQIMNKL